MAEKNRIRMARADNEENFQGHTIVGGRPAGKQDGGKGIPRAMELLVKKAAVDPAFREKLVSQRSKAADEIGIALDLSEKTMLDSIPPVQLNAIIDRTSVPSAQKTILLGTSAAAMMALVAQFAFSPVAGRAETPDRQEIAAEPLNPSDSWGWEGGARPDIPEPQSKGCRPDFPMPPGGARPDMPIPAPSPVPSENTQLKTKIVQSDVKGKSFLEAVEMLKNEVGVPIVVETPSGMDILWTVNESVQDRSLGEALENLCAAASGKGFKPRFLFEEKQVVIRFMRVSPGTPEPAINPSTGTGSRPDVPDAVTRGIRPDFPGKSD